jgi:lipoyl(octanoyl) transferase
VWIQDAQGDRKIAAIGIRVAQGVTMHGFALNVNPDLSAFRTIIPCGIADADVTSLEKELKKSITVDDVAPLVERHIFESLKKVSI